MSADTVEGTGLEREQSALSRFLDSRPPVQLGQQVVVWSNGEVMTMDEQRARTISTPTSTGVSAVEATHVGVVDVAMPDEVVEPSTPACVGHVAVRGPFLPFLNQPFMP